MADESVFSIAHIDGDDVRKALLQMSKSLREFRDEWGPKAFTGGHEALGVIGEKYNALFQAIGTGDVENFEKASRDIAVVAIWAMISGRKRDAEKSQR